MAEPCELYIARISNADNGKTVRIDAKRGPKLLGRIEINLEDFAAAIMGLGAVPATFTTARENPLRP